MLPKPLVVILCPEQFELFLGLHTEQLGFLEEKLEIRTADTPEQVRRYMNSTVRPHAVIVADAFVTTLSYRDVLIRLVDYARDGGTVIYAGLLGSFSVPSALNSVFEHVWGLPWQAGPYHHRAVNINTAVKGLDTKLVSQQCSMKAHFLSNVELQHAVYLEPLKKRRVKTGPHGRAVYDTPAAFAPVGRGSLGYIGDMNGKPSMTKLLLAMCLRPGSRAPIAAGTGIPPTTVSSAMYSAAAADPVRPLNHPRRTVLLLSLHKNDWHHEVYCQLYRALTRNAYLSEVCDPDDAAAALSDPSPPDAVVVSDAAITDGSRLNILQKLVEYTKNGGTLIFALSFSSFFPGLRAREFFQQWDLPWDAGEYFRTTFAPNPAGVPQPLSRAALLPSFSMKALHLKNVSPECAVYYAREEPDVDSESHVSAPAEDSPRQAPQTPAAFAPVGAGFLGYIGDVNGEQGSTRLILDMCGVHIRPGDLGSRKFMGSVHVGPGGNIESTTNTEEEVPLPAESTASLSADRPPRPREAEVRARAAACEKVRQEKTAKADKLKEEGNEFFKQEKWGKAAEKYREAALLAGPQPVYVSNLAAALLKLQEWEAAESAATRALMHDPNHIKSLFRRALASKARQRYTSAQSDLYHLLSIDKANEPARKELQEIQSLYDWDNAIDMNERNELREAIEIDYPDSDEYLHTGNFTPCKFHNHDGCLKGSSCRFMHSPDSKSVRDELGRNVCLSWLLGECYSGVLCVYAHDKTYLPERGWWTSQARLDWERSFFVEAVEADPMDVPESILAEALKPLYWRHDLWVHPSAEERAKALHPNPAPSTNASASSSRAAQTGRPAQGPARSNLPQRGARGNSRAARGGAQPHTGLWGGRYNNDDDDYGEDEDDLYDTDAELDELSMYCGHTRADYEELLCQGIKPWDVLPGSIPFNDL